MGITDKIAGLKSNRLRKLDKDARQPTPFEVYGGFGPAHAGLNDLPDDDPMAERSARVEGARALFELQQRRESETTAQVVPEHLRGRDYSRGLYG